MAINAAPISIPTGRTSKERFKGMRIAATIAPAATPTETITCNAAPSDKLMQRVFGPFQNNELQRCADAPKERCHRQRALPERVAPYAQAALCKIIQQTRWMAGLPRVASAGVRNAEIEQRSKDIKTDDEEQRGLGARVDQ